MRIAFPIFAYAVSRFGSCRLIGRWLVVAMLLLPFHAHAKPLIADLSSHHIAIDSRFTGTELLLFGAKNDIGDLVIVVRGPERSIMVRKKSRVAGIWVNTDQASFDAVPAYYAVASTRPLVRVVPPGLRSQLGLGIDSLHFPARELVGSIKPALLRNAFIAERIRYDLYTPSVPISFMGESLFKVDIPFPERIPRGVYTAELYLISDGVVTSMQSTPLEVYKVGVDAWIYDTAHRYPLLYGIGAVCFALMAGWLASLLFRKL
jgi:uncharacterized protein (TIGR02186 family)